MEPFPSTKIGDVSAIMLDHMPWIAGPFSSGLCNGPLSRWEEKISRTVEVLLKDRQLTMIGGVPTWNIVLIRKLLEHTGRHTCWNYFPGWKCICTEASGLSLTGRSFAISTQ